MITVVIIDDEVKIRKLLRNIITSHYARNITIAGEADSVKTGVDAIRRLKPDVVLLDIKLPDGTAFDIIKQAGNTDMKAIFVTAYDEYALKALKLSAVDYILKPIDIAELDAAFEKVSQRIHKEKSAKNVEALSSTIEKEEKKIVLKSSGTTYAISIKDIVRCEADWNYTRFYLANGTNLIAAKTLKKYEEILADSGFFRTHYAHLINLKYFSHSENKGRGGIVYLTNNDFVPLAFLRKKDLFTILKKPR